MTQETNISFVTLGCSKNEVDSDKMKARLVAAGFDIVDDPGDAALVIVNTCSFLASAVDESLEVIFDLVNAQSEREEPAKVLVAGCMPARYGSDLSDELTEVAGFLSAGDEEHVVEKVEDLLDVEPQVEPAHIAAYRARTRSQTGPSAYVKISDGCDRFCTYCMIPHIRGRYHSFALETIASEVEELVAGGAREIVLIGQDTGIWGRDFPEPDTTAHLLSTLAERFPHVWFRLLYLQPAGITDELLDAIAGHENVCDYLDMPLQHCDPQVLKRMNREGSAGEYLQVLARVRTRVPGITTRTTFMTGFPGESEVQFEELLDFSEDASFDYAVVFPYSREEGSAAARFENQVPEDERMERAQRLLDACDAIGHANAAKRIGQIVRALVEGFEETNVGTEALCRFQGQAPEVDGQVHVPLNSCDEVAIGDFVDVRILDSFYYELEGELIRP